MAAPTEFQLTLAWRQKLANYSRQYFDGTSAERANARAELFGDQSPIARGVDRVKWRLPDTAVDHGAHDTYTVTLARVESGVFADTGREALRLTIRQWKHHDGGFFPPIVAHCPDYFWYITPDSRNVNA